MNDVELLALKSAVDNGVAALTGVQEAVEKAIVVIGGQRRDNERLMNDLASARAGRDELFQQVNDLRGQLSRAEVERDGALGSVEQLQNQLNAATEQLQKVEEPEPVEQPAKAKSTPRKNLDPPPPGDDD